MRLPCCLCDSGICMCIPPFQIWMREPVFMKLGIYFMAPETISAAYFINPSHQYVSVYVSSPIVGRQRLGKHVPAVKNTRNNKRVIGHLAFYAVRVVSKVSL
jgi:hypothetical protein